MTPAWWVTWTILGLYGVNSIWLLSLVNIWGSLYWMFAAGINVCAMQALAR